MANDPTTKVIIEVDLDEESNNRAFNKLEKGAEEGGKKAGEKTGKFFSEEFKSQTKEMGAALAGIIAVEFVAKRLMIAAAIQHGMNKAGQNITFGKALKLEFHRLFVQAAMDFKTFVQKDLLIPIRTVGAHIESTIGRAFDKVFGSKVLKKAASKNGIAGLLGGAARDIDADFTIINETLNNSL